MERSEAYHLIEQICDDYGLTIAEREALKMAMHDIEFVDLMHADVAPVVHGKWIYHECVSSCDGTISGYSCSACCAFVDEEVFDMDEFHKDFCGNCGADMRERKGDDAEN